MDLNKYHENLKKNKNYVGQLSSFEVIEKLPNKSEEEIYSTADNQFYIVRDNKLVNITEGDNRPSATLYQLNQCMVGALNVVPQKIIDRKINIINNFLAKDNKYYMLLSNELRYYTLFVHTPEKIADNFGKTIFECLNIFGRVKYIECDEEIGTAEIWVQEEEDPYAHVFYLFPYDTGVIEVNGN